MRPHSPTSLPARRLRRSAASSVALLVAAATAACTAVISEPPVREAEAQVVPAPAALKRLTASQYRRTIHDLLGEDIAVPLALEPDESLAGFPTVGAGVASISARGVEQYERAALSIARQAMENASTRARLVPCTPDGPRDDACARRFVESFGRRAFRRPLDEQEVVRWVALAGDVATRTGSFEAGVEWTLAGMLQAQSFLFRVEVGRRDPRRPGFVRFDAWELASRLSYFLWNTTPDDALLDAAARGDLDDPAGYAREVDRLLASPRLAEGVRNFFTELLGLSELDDLVKDGKVFSNTSAELGPDSREETLRFLEDLTLTRDADWREAFTSRRTFVNRRLAALYRIPAPALEGFSAVDLPEGSGRAGLLGHASLLALHAHPVSTSPTLRGLFVRKVLLCAVIPKPPANVNTALPEPTARLPTLRDRLTRHRDDPACASCHSVLDPIGLGLEEFDGIGVFRTRDNGASIDASGVLDGVPFRNARELGQAIAAHPDLPGCLTRQLYRYAKGTPEVAGEEPEIDRLTLEFRGRGHRVRALLRAVALSEGFRAAGEGT